ncbi:hypothetical protein MER72_05870 [Acinetobacter baumannii]|nr:hypothetical protein [Acinetobacter baumannii]
MKTPSFENYNFYVGYMRYGGGGWLVGALYKNDREGCDELDEISECFFDIDESETHALRAHEYIKEHVKFLSHGDTPSQALKSVEDQITNYITNL